MPPKKTETGTTTQVSARVPNEVADYLQKLADDQERSLSWIVGKALRDWVAMQQAKK